MFTIAETWKQSKRPSAAEDKDVACVYVSHSVVFDSLQPHGQSPPSSSVCSSGILQARILEWVAIPFPRDLTYLGIKRRSPALQADSLPSEPTREAPKMWYLYTMEYYTTIKKNKIRPSAATDGSGDFHTKWTKSDRERQISYNISYTWNL